MITMLVKASALSKGRERCRQPAAAQCSPSSVDASLAATLWPYATSSFKHVLANVQCTITHFPKSCVPLTTLVCLSTLTLTLDVSGTLWWTMSVLHTCRPLATLYYVNYSKSGAVRSLVATSMCWF